MLIDSTALKSFEGVLDSFVNNVTNACSNMETGISSCNKYMNDETSQRILSKSSQAIEQIRAVFAPAQRILELVREELNHLSKEPPTNI